MEPKVRYTRSADGTRIAMWVLGSGRPALVNPHSIWFTSMESFWHIPQEREGIERMAEKRMFVRFDNRGHGLSQRDVSDFSLEARVNDLAAVVNHAGSPVDLLASGNAAPAGIAFAGAHPTEVRRLVLRSAAARATDRAQGLGQGTLDRVFSQLRRVDWETYIRTASAVTFGWNEVGVKVGEASVGSVAPELFVESMRAVREYDATDLLSEIQCPTLVIHRKGDQMPISVSQHMAAAIPNARLVVLDQERNLVFARESREIIEEFLDEEEPPLKPARPGVGELPSGTAVILFADIVDSTALTERLGDADFRAKARELDGALRAVIREHAGTAIEGKLLGDGVLAVFGSARQAIEAALACASAGNREGLPLHLGLHAGDVIREEGNVYGGAVNIAARIAGLSAAGEVLVSETVRSLARTSAGVRFEDRGEQALKGIGEAVRVWAIVEGAGA